MITRKEFVILYKKNLSGQCSPAEKELLESYSDEMQLADGDWEGDEAEKHLTANRIWLQLSESRKVQKRISLYQKYSWIRVAAVLLILVSAGFGIFWFMDTAPKTFTTINTNISKIAPGGNKAYLTTASGEKIFLNEVKIGSLSGGEGVSINKTDEGTLVYNLQSNNAKQSGSHTEWNTIVTPRAGQYHIVLADGSKVWLNAVSSLRFPTAFNGATREVELTGEAYFEVAKNKAKPFTVKTGGTTVNVLGTHFNVNAYKDNGEIKTTLIEGSVRLADGKTEVKLIPGQQGRTTGTGFIITPADLEETMAWKNGYFIFRDENVISIMKRVARWYDVEIIYKDDMKDRAFGGTVSRYKDITELLDYMQLTQAIHYRLEGRRVIIMK
jgi:transmembrane sensor